MASAEVIVAINKVFEKRVLRLANDAKGLAESYADMTERMLHFAKEFKVLT